MDFLDTKFIETIITSVTMDNTIIEDYKIDENIVSPGCNFNSRVCQLDISYMADNDIKSSRFIMKIPSLSPIYDVMKDFQVYEKEKIMYNEVFPEMMKWVNGPWLVPRSYTSLHPEVLILEDLRRSGYRTSDRKIQLNLQQCLSAIKTIAQFHASSLVANSVAPEVMNKAKFDYLLSRKDTDEINNDIQKRLFCHLINIINRKPEMGKGVSFLQKIKDNICIDVSNLLKSNEDNFNVLNHGDCWNNNITFKYDQEGNVVHSKLIDFQMCHWCRPCIDIWYLLVTSTQFDVVERNFDEILKLYIDTLNQLLKSNNYPEMYTMEQLEKDMKESMLYGVSLLPLHLSANLAESTIDMSEFKHEEFLKRTGLDAAMNEEHFINECCKWISYFSEL